MTLVVFLRGANVGGHRTFQPSALAKELSDLDVVNIGAAGAFVVRKRIGQAALRAQFARRVPFEPELKICTARELIALANGDNFPEANSDPDARRCVSVMAKQLPKLPPLPLSQPEGDDWQVKIIRVLGKFALSLHRRTG